jgi:hypothetical protein
MGKADRECWLRRYPNFYFDVTAAVRSLDEIQFAGSELYLMTGYCWRRTLHVSQWDRGL